MSSVCQLPSKEQMDPGVIAHRVLVAVWQSEIPTRDGPTMC
jgi:hypothetical protein